MKTKEQIEAEIAKLDAELEAVVKAEAEKSPDFLVNFNPKKIEQVLDFFEDGENCKKFLKNSDEVKWKWGVDSGDWVYKGILQFEDYSVEVVDQEGGREGEGEHWHCVFKVEKGGELVGHYYIPGYYQSYNGTEIEWDGIYEVEPYEKMVIAWRAKA